MHEALNDLLERADLAVAAASSVVTPERLTPLVDTVAATRLRLQYPEDIIVVALAGGTGSGKSSLFNVLTDTDEAEIGVTRPTTSQPLAGISEKYGEAMVGLLADIGITRQVTQTKVPDLCVIDLPDTDSVEVDHRHQVEAVMPRLDVMVWVVDPEKYRDAALHHRYLRPLAEYGAQFVVVLNQIDRLDPTDLAAVVADLRVALVEDGLADVPILEVAASPPVGPPVGVDALVDRLDTLAANQAILYSKQLADLNRWGNDLSEAIGPPVSYRERVGEMVEQAAASIVGGDPSGAVDTLTGFLSGISAAVGGPTGSLIDGVMAGLPVEVHEVSAGLSPEPPRRRWRRAPEPSTHRHDQAVKGVEGLLDPVEKSLQTRAFAAAAVTDLVLGVDSMRARLAR